MDVREKLVDIVCDATQINGCIHSCNHPPCAMVQGIVDALIENGVTVQEWVLADNRLPEIPEGLAESPEPVLYMMKNTKTIYAGYYGEGGVWRDKYFRRYSDGRNGVDADDVTCWMYQCDLSQPPKGE